jgi:hypothetical protein
LDLLKLEDVTVGCPESYIRVTTNISWAQAEKDEGLNNFLFPEQSSISLLLIENRNYECV